MLLLTVWFLMGEFLMDRLKQLMAKIEARASTISEDKNPPNETEERRNLCENSVTKSNSLARSYYRFNLIEKRVMESLISQLNPQSMEESQLQKLELRATDYAKAFEVPEKHAYRDLEKAISGLMHRVFSIAIPDGREEFTLMSNAQYLEGEGRVTCSFNSYVSPHLIGLKQRFSKYPLRVTVNFKSSYTWRLYEVLVSWAKDPKYTDGVLAGWCTVEVDDLRKMLGVPESYKWCHFQKQVLDIAQLELRNNANIELEIERIKTGRKITHLKFTFAEMENKKERVACNV